MRFLFQSSCEVMFLFIRTKIFTCTVEFGINNVCMSREGTCIHCQEQDGCKCHIKENIHSQFIFLHFEHFANLILYVFFVQNCIRDITDALIAMCEDRQEDEETAMLSNSQIVHSVIDIFGAGERPGVKRLNVLMSTALYF